MADVEVGRTCKREVIAFYLPQFHPIPENDQVWGPGFTEWTNVASGRPLFPGHQQPRLPGELGFYDLRVPEVREAQAALAADHGITAFCYWHYWFAGRRVPERPIEEVLASGAPTFPFCLGWANVSWTAEWFGRPEDVLIEQTFPGRVDDEEHFQVVSRFFSDPRYLRIDGKPLFVLFRPENLPNLAAFTGMWRRMAADIGLPGLYLVGQTKGERASWDTGLLDATVVVRYEGRASIRGKISGALARMGLGPQVVPYDRTWERWLDPPQNAGIWHPTVMPNWDNTPRKGRRGTVLVGATPEVFAQQVRRALEIINGLPGEPLLFVKSWNEWAEGNYLEPDATLRRAFLEALRSELEVVP